MINKMVFKMKVMVAPKGSRDEGYESKWISKTYKNIERNKYNEVPINELQDDLMKQVKDKYDTNGIVEDYSLTILDED